MRWYHNKMWECLEGSEDRREPLSQQLPLLSQHLRFHCDLLTLHSQYPLMWNQFSPRATPKLQSDRRYTE